MVTDKIWEDWDDFVGYIERDLYESNNGVNVTFGNPVMHSNKSEVLIKSRYVVKEIYLKKLKN